jgi:predicted lysophospholipase L1 biosynthesis ABC-type transport system permease subunit
MALGLVVGVAALGVISARAVVERRQQIGVMRAIGFRRGMIQAVFLLESSFVALTAIVVGTALGLLLGWNIIQDQRETPSWENVAYVVPWGDLALVFTLVYAVALLERHRVDGADPRKPRAGRELESADQRRSLGHGSSLALRGFATGSGAPLPA